MLYEILLVYIEMVRSEIQISFFPNLQPTTTTTIIIIIGLIMLSTNLLTVEYQKNNNE